MSDIATHLAAIRDRIRTSCLNSGRESESVLLVAVSKTFPVETIRHAYDAGHRVFGESRLQEAESKIAQLPSDIQWHFIGRVQRNKLRKILSSFEVIHGIDSLITAETTDRIAAELGIVAKIFLQINIAAEESKGGFTPRDLSMSITRIAELSHLDLQGFMAIPPPAKSRDDARHWFSELRNFRDFIQEQHGIRLANLSIGMSDDFETAISEGSTVVRIGSAIFGNR